MGSERIAPGVIRGESRRAPSPSWYKPVAIAGARDLLDYERELPSMEKPQGWLFRGTSQEYSLQTSLERALEDAAVPLSDAPRYERQLIKDFKRRAHQYLDKLPNEGDIMAWLSLMQHYGAPTRLLDWTYSFYIAAFFALSEAVSNPPPNRTTGIVWAVHRDAFTLQHAPSAREAVRRAGPPVDDVGRPDAEQLYDGVNAFIRNVMNDPQKCVWTVNSFRLNERLAIQQGVFLCPGDVRSSFEDNLKAGMPNPGAVARFELSTEPGARRDMLTALHRMNINYASLFPGLEGLARSLKQSVWLTGGGEDETGRP